MGYVSNTAASFTMICGLVFTISAETNNTCAAPPNIESTQLTQTGKKLAKQYADQLEILRTRLTAQVPPSEQTSTEQVNKFLSSDSLDSSLSAFVVLRDATPQGLAEFAQQGDSADWIH